MFDNWKELEESIKNCKKCNLYRNRTNIVFGMGNKNADIMFIGEGQEQMKILKQYLLLAKQGNL